MRSLTIGTVLIIAGGVGCTMYPINYGTDPLQSAHWDMNTKIESIRAQGNALKELCASLSPAACESQAAGELLDGLDLGIWDPAAEFDVVMSIESKGIPKQDKLTEYSSAKISTKLKATRVYEYVDVVASIGKERLAGEDAIIGKLGAIKTKLESLKSMFDFLKTIVGNDPDRTSGRAKFAAQLLRDMGERRLEGDSFLTPNEEAIRQIDAVLPHLRAIRAH